MGLELRERSFEGSPALMVTAVSGYVRCSGDRVVIKAIASGAEGKSLANACSTSRGEIPGTFGVENTYLLHEAKSFLRSYRFVASQETPRI
jgi:hypothetical protein